MDGLALLTNIRANVPFAPFSAVDCCLFFIIKNGIISFQLKMYKRYLSDLNVDIPRTTKRYRNTHNEAQRAPGEVNLSISSVSIY